MVISHILWSTYYGLKSHIMFLSQIVVIIMISVKGLKISHILAPIYLLFVSNAKTVIGHTI